MARREIGCRLGLEFLGPQAPHGRSADAAPDDVPSATKNVPTFYRPGGRPETAVNQLDYAFASRGGSFAGAAKVELPPATPAAATVCRGRPLTYPDDGQTRAVEHEMDGLAGRDPSQTAPQMPTAPGERRRVWGGEVEAHHPEQRVQEPFGLADPHRKDYKTRCRETQSTCLTV